MVLVLLNKCASCFWSKCLNQDSCPIKSAAPPLSPVSVGALYLGDFDVPHPHVIGPGEGKGQRCSVAAVCANVHVH